MSGANNPAGGYRYVPGIPPYSAGVRADDDHVIVRVQLVEPTPWVEGLALADRVLADAGRPAAALCAVELRCDEPHSFDGFGSFNDDYRAALDERDILLDGGINPVARTNVAPRGGTGGPTLLHAFSYTIPSATAATTAGEAGGRPSFVIAGAGDLADQSDLRPEAIVGGDRPWADTGPARADAVLAEMEARLATLGLGWGDTDVAVVYSVERIGEVAETTILPRLGPAAANGLHWHHARPPIDGLRFEMDTRGGVVERRR